MLRVIEGFARSTDRTALTMDLPHCFLDKSNPEYNTIQYSFIEKLTNRNLKNRPTEILKLSQKCIVQT